MKYSTDDRIEAEVKRLIKAGWQFERGKRHPKITAPNGRTIAIPSSPSDRRTALNWKTRVKRIEELQ